jgi:hypothetical protein
MGSIYLRTPGVNLFDCRRSSLKVYDDPSEDCEVVIEFTDGTTFSCAIEQRASMKSVLFRGSVGTPEILRDYNP